ncbi:MAG: metal ABC transporter ATP-binding protein [Bacillota bacterium]
MRAGDTVIEVRNLSVAFNGCVVLEHVTFQVTRGTLVGLLGPNGAGKTTLLKTIMGLVKPSSGQVRLLGMEANGSRQVAGRVGYVPQAPTIDRGFPLSVLDVVLMGRLSASRVGQRLNSGDRDAAINALEHVDMLDYAHTAIGRLSGGQQQRVLLARALVRAPEVLLLDEPGTALDTNSKDRLYYLLARLKMEKNLTSIVVSHDIAPVLAYADEVICVDRTLHVHANTSEIRSNPELYRSCRCNFQLWSCSADREELRT